MISSRERLELMRSEPQSTSCVCTRLAYLKICGIESGRYVYGEPDTEPRRHCVNDVVIVCFDVVKADRSCSASTKKESGAEDSLLAGT